MLKTALSDEVFSQKVRYFTGNIGVVVFGGF
jgi:hypothetical protein